MGVLETRPKERLPEPRPIAQRDGWASAPREVRPRPGSAEASSGGSPRLFVAIGGRLRETA
jgi:hypothetical protein